MRTYMRYARMSKVPPESKAFPDKDSQLRYFRYLCVIKQSKQ